MWNFVVVDAAERFLVGEGARVIIQKEAQIWV